MKMKNKLTVAIIAGCIITICILVLFIAPLIHAEVIKMTMSAPTSGKTTTTTVQPNTATKSNAGYPIAKLIISITPRGFNREVSCYLSTNGWTSINAGDIYSIKELYQNYDYSTNTWSDWILIDTGADFNTEEVLKLGISPQIQSTQSGGWLARIFGKLGIQTTALETIREMLEGLYKPRVGAFYYYNSQTGQSQKQRVKCQYFVLYHDYPKLGYQPLGETNPEDDSANFEWQAAGDATNTQRTVGTETTYFWITIKAGSTIRSGPGTDYKDVTSSFNPQSGSYYNIYQKYKNGDDLWFKISGDGQYWIRSDRVTIYIGPESNKIKNGPYSYNSADISGNIENIPTATTAEISSLPKGGTTVKGNTEEAPPVQGSAETAPGSSNAKTIKDILDNGGKLP